MGAPAGGRIMKGSWVALQNFRHGGLGEKTAPGPDLLRLPVLTP